MNKKARVIALYLPQYHPIPENDKYWGKGFTEWTNVAKAKPLFRGHYQPKIPADLGFYDLRMPEIREMQARLAREAGIEGFCYWHYWFGNGKELLERPFNEVVDSGKPDFPFCLGWANHNWSTSTWTTYNSQYKEVLIAEQIYPGIDDYTLHFNKYLKAFKDKRYIKVDGKLFFLIYSPRSIPNFIEFKETWNKLARENGLNGFLFVGISDNFSINKAEKSEIIKRKIDVNIFKHFAKTRYNEVLSMGFDAVNSLGINRAQVLSDTPVLYYFKRFLMKILKIKITVKFNYKRLVDKFYVEEDTWENVYPTIIANYDRSPRSGKNTANIWYNSKPELFKKQIQNALNLIKNKSDEHKILILKSWNEWGEGNYVEPDQKYDRGYLDALKETIFVTNESS